jgi:hypothetical protein
MDDRAVEKRQSRATADGIDRNSGKGRSTGRGTGHAAGRNDDVPRGILCMVVATILFSAASAASKWLVEIYPVGEVLCLRSLASLAAGAAVILPVTGLSVFATHRPRDHLARGLSQSISRSLHIRSRKLINGGRSSKRQTLRWTEKQQGRASPPKRACLP